MNSLKFPLILMVTVGFVSAAHAETVTITQKGRQFSSETLNVKKGDVVVFNNDDSVPHNAVSKSAGNEFDLGYQAPGASTPVTFDKPGDIVVNCTIHPKMKMTIHVE
jgi:plastocyanin